VSHHGPEAAERSKQDRLPPSFLPIPRQLDMCFVIASNQRLFLASGPTFDLPLSHKGLASVGEFS
jgi:hypothetical protein